MLQSISNKTSFIKSWVLVTTLGSALFGVLNILINTNMNHQTGNYSLSVFVLMAAAGIGITALTGFLQSRVLRRHLGNVSGWTMATLVGALLSSLTIVLFTYLATQLFPTMPGTVFRASALLGIAALALVQREVLKHWVKRSAWWVLILVLAFSASLAFSSGLSALLSYSVEIHIELVISSIIEGLAIGLISGVGLAWLMRGAAERRLPGQPSKTGITIIMAALC